jgi:hypothetical protein
MRELGIPLRTYRRYLATFRSAGMIFEVGCKGSGLGYVRFVAFDVMFAENCEVA